MSISLYLNIEAAEQQLRRLKDEKVCDTQSLRELAGWLDQHGGKLQMLRGVHFEAACEAAGIPKEQLPDALCELITTLNFAGEIPQIDKRLDAALKILEPWSRMYGAHA